MPQKPAQASPPERRTLLLLEDDDGVRRSLEMMLRNRGYDVHAHAAADALLADPATDAATLLVSDYRLPGMDGLAMIAVLRQRGWRGRAVLITASMSATLRKRALSSGFDAVLEKPMLPNALIAALEDSG
jgi:CheY-like chemotaxis protein